MTSNLFEIPSDQGFELKNFVIPSHYKDDLSSVLIPNGFIGDRIEKMAQDIHKDYGEQPIHLLCVLKGGQQFFADLIYYLKRFHRYNAGVSVPFSEDFIRISSYENDQSTGNIKISGADLKELKGKNVLIVEDIIDTGKTIKELIEELKKHSPESTKVASLLVKRTKQGIAFNADYVGFSIPDVFVVGYCLDYNEFFRDLDHICAISEIGKKKYGV